MIDPALYFILPLALAAFFLKGLATFGAAIVLVPLAALVVGVKEIVLVMAFLDLISNAMLYRPRKSHFRDPYLIGMTLLMMVGVAIGGLLLRFLPADQFKLIFAAILIPLGFFMIVTSFFKPVITQANEAPHKSSRLDRGIALASGCMGGLSGLTGPVLAWYLNLRFSKQVFRDIMIPLLLVSACARLLTYGLSGAFEASIIPIVLLAIPGLLIGTWLGNRLFFKISQQWFGVVIGALISASGVKLLTR